MLIQKIENIMKTNMTIVFLMVHLKAPHTHTHQITKYEITQKKRKASKGRNIKKNSYNNVKCARA